MRRRPGRSASCSRCGSTTFEFYDDNAHERPALERPRRDRLRRARLGADVPRGRDPRAPARVPEGAVYLPLVVGVAAGARDASCRRSRRTARSATSSPARGPSTPRRTSSPAASRSSPSCSGCPGALGLALALVMIASTRCASACSRASWACSGSSPAGCRSSRSAARCRSCSASGCSCSALLFLGRWPNGHAAGLADRQRRAVAELGRGARTAPAARPAGAATREPADAEPEPRAGRRRAVAAASAAQAQAQAPLERQDHGRPAAWRVASPRSLV